MRIGGLKGLVMILYGEILTNRKLFLKAHNQGLLADSFHSPQSPGVRPVKAQLQI